MVVNQSPCTGWSSVIRWMVKGSCPSDFGGLSFGGCTIGRLTFLRPWLIWKRLFEKDFFEREISSVKTWISMKALVCGGEFSLWIIERSIYTTSESMGLVYKRLIINTTQKIDGDKIFLHGNPIWEKLRGGKFTIILQFIGIADS